MHGMPDNSKESDDNSQYDKLALPSSPKGEIVGIMAQVWGYGTGVVLHGNILW